MNNREEVVLLKLIYCIVCHQSCFYALLKSPPNRINVIDGLQFLGEIVRLLSVKSNLVTIGVEQTLSVRFYHVMYISAPIENQG